MAVSRIETSIVFGLMGLFVVGAAAGIWHVSATPPVNSPQPSPARAIVTAAAAEVPNVPAIIPATPAPLPTPQPFVATAANANDWRPEILPVGWPPLSFSDDKPLPAKTVKAKIEGANALLSRWAAYKKSGAEKDLPTDKETIDTVRYLFSIARSDGAFPEAWATFIKVRRADQDMALERAKIALGKETAEDKRLAKKRGVTIGMTQEQVTGSSWGKPSKINTTITAGGRHEQWVYGGSNYLYFENGTLTSIQTGP